MTLSSDFAISRRQAYRYVRQARGLDVPVPIAEPAIAVTVKLPGDVARHLRAHAADSGLTQGEIVARALAVFLGRGHDRV